MTNTDTSESSEAVKTELDLIFNLDSAGKEIAPPEIKPEEDEKQAKEVGDCLVAKKKLLSDEDNKESVVYGLQEPAVKKQRFIDRQQHNKVADSLPAAKVLAREAKAGNTKLLSFYNEEEEEEEEED